ncbi:hypothetical protein GGI00_005550, partial [Coemansia sp. RSA 2681]
VLLGDSIFPSLGKALWQETPEVTQPPAGVPSNYNSRHVGRHPQPPSGVHVPAPKDRPVIVEEEGHADFMHKENNITIRSATVAPGYQYTAPVLKGVVSVLDPNKQSPLNTDAPLAFTSVTSPYKPNTKLFDASAIRTPLPTNKWWQNLVIEQGVDPIHPYPYVVKCLANASTVGFPKFQATATAMTSNMAADWQIGDANAGALTQRLVTAYDALGVQVVWTGGSGGNAKMAARFYKGLPFVTYEMTAMAPMLSTIHAILKVEQLALTVNSYGANAPGNATKLAQQMADRPSLTQVTLNDGSQWLLVTKPTIQWKQAGNSQLVPQAMTAPFTGILQLAHLGDSPGANAGVLQAYAGTYPTEGSVTYAKILDKQGTGRSADIVYVYKTNTDGGGDSSRVYAASSVPASMQLLTLVLPHHVALLPSASILSPGLAGYRCAKGPLAAVAGNIIAYSQPLDGTQAFEGAHA